MKIELGVEVMERFIPIAVLVALAVLGFFIKCIELNHLSRKIDFTIKYRNKFVELLNDCLVHGNLNNDLYTELTEQVVEMQKSSEMTVSIHIWLTH